MLTMSGSSALKLIQNAFRKSVEANTFYRVMNKVNIVDAGGGKLTAEIKVDESHINYFKTMHGGLIATMADTLSTTALQTLNIKSDTDEIKEPQSVSVKLDITFLRPIPLDSEIIIKCSTVNRGKTLAYAQIDFMDKTTGKILVKGNHLMFIRK
ncbi:acyl-coenzyme A thioesterase 13-like [Brevipalpus obovatus]|uniref:acyl-coenzyme A thioesterase 13-like n=1 Tax=Brevipalpus obovatus TaxID=246614 RepID=UPI003D9DED38